MFYKNNLKLIGVFLLLSAPFGIISGINPPPNLMENQKIEVSLDKQFSDKNFSHKAKRINKKIGKIKAKQKKGKRVRPLLFFSLFFLAVGIGLLLTFSGAGLAGIFRLILGVPITVGGIVLLIIAAFKDNQNS